MEQTSFVLLAQPTELVHLLVFAMMDIMKYRRFPNARNAQVSATNAQRIRIIVLSVVSIELRCLSVFVPKVLFKLILMALVIVAHINALHAIQIPVIVSCAQETIELQFQIVIAH